MIIKKREIPHAWRRAARVGTVCVKVCVLFIGWSASPMACCCWLHNRFHGSNRITIADFFLVFASQSRGGGEEGVLQRDSPCGTEHQRVQRRGLQNQEDAVHPKTQAHQREDVHPGLTERPIIHSFQGGVLWRGRWGWWRVRLMGKRLKRKEG